MTTSMLDEPDAAETWPGRPKVLVRLNGLLSHAVNLGSLECNWATELEASVVTFHETDQTPGKEATDWIVDALHRRCIIPQTIPHVLECMRDFVANRDRLPVARRGLERIRSYQGLRQAVLFVTEAADDVPGGGRELDREYMDMAMAQSTVVRETDDGVTVVTTHTPFAAGWWSAGEFRVYMGAFAALTDCMIFVMPDGRRFLINASHDMFIAGYGQIVLDDIRSYWDHFAPILKDAIDAHPTFARFLPPEALTPDVFRRAVAADPECPFLFLHAEEEQVPRIVRDMRGWLRHLCAPGRLRSALLDRFLRLARGKHAPLSWPPFGVAASTPSSNTEVTLA